MQAYITKSEEEVLSGILQAGLKSLRGGMKNNSYVFIEFVLAERAHNEALGDLFDRSIEL